MLDLAFAGRRRRNTPANSYRRKKIQSDPGVSGSHFGFQNFVIEDHCSDGGLLGERRRSGFACKRNIRNSEVFIGGIFGVTVENVVRLGVFWVVFFWILVFVSFFCVPYIAVFGIG